MAEKHTSTGGKEEEETHRAGGSEESGSALQPPGAGSSTASGTSRLGFLERKASKAWGRKNVSGERLRLLRE